MNVTNFPQFFPLLKWYRNTPELEIPAKVGAMSKADVRAAKRSLENAAGTIQLPNSPKARTLMRALRNHGKVGIKGRMDPAAARKTRQGKFEDRRRQQRRAIIDKRRLDAYLDEIDSLNELIAQKKEDPIRSMRVLEQQLKRKGLKAARDKNATAATSAKERGMGGRGPNGKSWFEEHGHNDNERRRRFIRAGQGEGPNDYKEFLKRKKEAEKRVEKLKPEKKKWNNIRRKPSGKMGEAKKENS